MLREINFPKGNGEFWTMKICNDPVILPTPIADNAVAMLSSWQTVFTRENSFVQRELGIPSVICRIDCAGNMSSPDPASWVYEIEERPSGIGLTREINPQFRSLLDSLKIGWPKFKVVCSANRGWSDDHLWLETISLEQALKEQDSLLLIRAEPDEKDFHPLVARSISAVETKGDKSYGIEMGLWYRVNFSNGETLLPWDKPFCIKPMKGSKGRNIEVWLPNGGRNNKGSTKTRIIRVLEQSRSMYLQPYIKPLDVFMENRTYNAIYRLFFGYNTKTNTWIPLGGVRCARPAPNWKIHGASDTITQPVILS